MSTVTTVFVCTLNQGIASWSRYVFPYRILNFAMLGNDLYLREGDTVLRVENDVHTDDVNGVPTPFAGIVQWPWLDCGPAGVTKMMEGFDIVCTAGTPSVQIGYNQRDLTAFTAAYAVATDTYNADIIPLPVSAPSFSLKVTFAGGEAWQLTAANLYVYENRPGS